MILGGRYGNGSAKIYEHRMIIVGGKDADDNVLSSGFIYDVRTQQSTPLPIDMPEALADCCVVANDGFVYVLGGFGNNGHVNTVYRLCFETQVWSIMAPMDTVGDDFAAVVKENYIYLFGGCSNSRSTQRYCIDNNTWEHLPAMPKGRRVGCLCSNYSGQRDLHCWR